VNQVSTEFNSSCASAGNVKTSLIRSNIIECHTEESSDDDISYGSDGSSIGGADTEIYDCVPHDYEPLFSDEEDFSEDEEDHFDFGPLETSTVGFPPLAVAESLDLQYEFEEDFLSKYEEDEHGVPSVIDEDKLFTIIEESDAVIEEHDKSDQEYDNRIYSDYCDFYYSQPLDHGVFTAFQVNGPLMTSVDDDELILFTISEEPELEEKCDSDLALTRRSDQRIHYSSSSWPREDTKTETEDRYNADLDSLISNLEASLKQSKYTCKKGHASSSLSSLPYKLREKSPDSVSKRTCDAQYHDRMPIGLPLLNLDESLTIR